MERVFADTSFFYALADQNEGDYHKRAKQWFLAHHKTAQIYSSSYIFDELATLLLARTNKKLCIQFCTHLRNSPSIVWKWVNEDVAEKSWELFCAYSDKYWSVTDCTSQVLMTSLKITRVLTWDHNFSQMGFESVLETELL